MEKKEKLAQELAELRAKHSKVREFIVPTDEDDETKTLTFFLRPLDKPTRGMIEKISKTNTDRAVVEGLKALRLGGDDVEELYKNDYAMLAAEQGLVEYMSVAKVIIKKN